jgi:hypothetical protein
MTNYSAIITAIRCHDNSPIMITNTLKIQESSTCRSFSQLQYSEGAQRIQKLPNAGGNSANSEVLSFEVLNCVLNAKLKATEMELEYCPLGSKITDFSISVNVSSDEEIMIGVSVTRAMKFFGRFDEIDAEKLLTKKLYGVNESSKAVLKRYRWKKQILHIWAQYDYIVDVLERVYHSLSESLKSNTIVMISTCNSSRWVFFEDNF